MIPNSTDCGSKRILLVIWLCFVFRGLFYSALFPIWEGYDEYSHFAFIQHLTHKNTLPSISGTRISLEIEESLRLVPLPWLMRGHPPAPDARRLLEVVGGRTSTPPE